MIHLYSKNYLRRSKIKKLLLPLFVLTQFVFANPPEWEYNPADFEYVMNMNVAVLSDDGELMGDDGDMLAAFGEDGSVRSLGYPLYVPFGPYVGEILWELGIGSSDDLLEIISFKYYDASVDQIFSFIEQYPFEANYIWGDVINPIIFTLGEAECEYDECGVCDGPGAVYECGCSDAVENYDCDGDCVVEVDCTGTCGGDAVIDECGVCDGDGIDEGACDCYGNTLDGCDVCGGEANGTDCNNDGMDDDCEDEFQSGFESGFFEGESTGDINHDGDTNVTDIVIIINNILNN